ncbi:MAG: peptide MFS transporter [Longimicrobiales bacterium]|nr:peptide MFS transporter [Longimicrobiales bacterium]
MSTDHHERSFFGHPQGLSTLFFTEMWERFSYYGMRALLILFMTTETTHVIRDAAGNAVRENPGMGLDVATAAAIYGLYTSLVYIMSLPGGWVADNLWGQRKAVWVGGWIIAAGHFTMAAPTLTFGLVHGPSADFTFFLGLVLIVLGTGLLKPNVSTVVGDLYPEGGARRDAGFSIFYMGINIGALAGPIITGILGEGYNWHWGFGAAGVGMAFGLLQYRVGMAKMGDAGLLKSTETPERIAALTRRFFGVFSGGLAVVVVFGFLVANGAIPLTLTQIASYLGSGVLVLVFLYFVYLWFAGGHTPDENKRLGVIFWLFILIAVFWSGFEQAGSSLNLFAQDLTDRRIPSWIPILGNEVPASLLQSINPLFIIVLAPVFGSIWVWLEKRQVNPSIPMKAGLGLIGLAMGFFVLSWGAANATSDTLVTPAWLIVTYFLHTAGELTISPVGLSAITKLAPAKRVGQMMGIWFVGAALGNLIAGLVAGQLESLAPFALFRTVALITGGVGIFAVLVSPAVRRLMGEVR